MRVSEHEIDTALQTLSPEIRQNYVSLALKAIASELSRSPDYWKRFGGYAPEVARLMQAHGMTPPEGSVDDSGELVLYRHADDIRTAIAVIITAQNSLYRNPSDPFSVETPKGTGLYQWGVGLIDAN